MREYEHECVYVRARLRMYVSVYMRQCVCVHVCVYRYTISFMIYDAVQVSGCALDRGTLLLGRLVTFQLQASHCVHSPVPSLPHAVRSTHPG